ncbi:MAG: elongation factor P [Planctomycetota bacterium]
MIKAVDLRKGKTILHDGLLMIVHEVQHVAKGNKRSHMQTRLRNFKTGIMSDVRFSVDDRVEVPFVEAKEFEFLYREGENYMIMDMESFDQIPVSPAVVGDSAQFLTPNVHISCQVYEGAIVSFELPHIVELTVTDTPPVVRGATATNQSKDAILETGARVRVPPFIETGEKLRIDTRTGEYVERAK